MLEWVNQTLESPTFSLAVLLAAFLLGLISSVASACCSLPILGAVVGYSGAQQIESRRTNLLFASFFLMGAVIALIILGIVSGFIGQVAQSSLGRYWKVFAGIIVIFFGLATLRLLPFKLSQRRASESKLQPKGLFAAAAFGFVIGGAVSLYSLCCSPGIFGVLAVVMLKGYSLSAMVIMASYAIGFSLPLAAIVLGVSFGKMAVKTKGVDTAMRIAAGVLLIGIGFYFLATL